jgi:mono/diheme cytochrome c family protein
LKDWSDGEIIRAVREGIHKNGRPLVIMPADAFHNLSDADVQALVAYLRSQPAVQHDTPEINVSVIGALVIATGAPLQTNQPPITQPIVAPAPGVTVEYGKHLASIMGCQSCHGADLAGGTPGFGPPPGPNLTVLVPKWSEADFLKTLKTGVDPTGKTLSDEMPWKEYAVTLTDDEFKAIFAYMKGLSPIVRPASK